MSIMSFPTAIQPKSSGREVKYPLFGRPKGEPTEIEADMTPDEVARVITAKVMAYIEAEFEVVRKQQAPESSK